MGSGNKGASVGVALDSTSFSVPEDHDSAERNCGCVVIPAQRDDVRGISLIAEPRMMVLGMDMPDVLLEKTRGRGACSTS